MGKFSTMHYAMSHSIDLCKRFYGSVPGIGELRKNKIDALLMICYFHLYLLAVAVSGFEFEKRGFKSYLLHSACGENGAAFHVIKLVLD